MYALSVVHDEDDVMEVTLHDSEGNIIEQPDCACGRKSDTFIAGKEHIQWYCNECLYGSYSFVNLKYDPHENLRSEYGTALNDKFEKAKQICQNSWTA